MWLSWKLAVLAAAICVIATVTARRSRRPRARAVATFTNELSIVLILYALWRLAGTLSVMNTDRARSRGDSLWHLERTLHLPSEVTVQRWIDPHPVLTQAANVYYLLAHVPALIVFLLWLFIWHRDAYPRWRNTLALLTGGCLLIQLVPVAPPRMFPEFGFVDTAVRYHQSVYGSIGSGMADQLSAMPSVHVGWAVLIGVASVRVGRSRWRWLALLHSITTIFVVTVTANHWWMDGIGAVVVLAASAGVARAGEAWADRYWPTRRRLVLAADEPGDESVPALADLP